jgi:TPP-dependent indolepyruvate ferredoxin oxidoreductase alpha subunit
MSTIVLAEAAPQLSRIFDVPVVIRLTNRAVRFEEKDAQPFPATERIVELAEVFVGKQFAKPQVEPLVHPVNGDAHRKLIAAKNKAIQHFVNEVHRLINIDGIKGNIYCGHDAHAAGGHIITLPVPTEDIEQVGAVYEVGDSVIAKELSLQTATAKFTSRTLGYNPENANHYIITPRYERLFRLLKPRYEYITGDLGEYTKDTLHTLTHCLCFGAAISAAVGMCEAGKKALAITGDASFYHSAKNAIIEAGLRGVAVKVVLIDNGGSQGTGGQKIPGVMPDNVDVTEIDFDTIDKNELEKIVSAFAANPKSAILKVNHKV